MKNRNMMLAVLTLALLSAATFTAVAAFAPGAEGYGGYGDTVPYMYYEDGEMKEGTVTDYVLVEDNSFIAYEWNVIQGHLTVNERVRVDGHVHIILVDGCRVTFAEGITVPADATLEIHAQSGGTGTLVADARFIDTDGSAGIGGFGDNVPTLDECGTIIIHGGNITATGAQGGPGIGGAWINGGGNIVINGGSVTATGSEGGAGIGTGEEGVGGRVTINGGTVVATSPDASGIGGGLMGGGVDITITGGNVTATGGDGNPGIGGSSMVTGCTFSTTGERGPGNAVIRASSISASTDRSSWSGVVFEGSSGSVYGDVTLASDVAIPAGGSLTVPSGATLTVPSGRTVTVTTGTSLTNLGTIVVDGSGSLVLDGEFVNEGTFLESNDSDPTEPEETDCTAVMDDGTALDLWITDDGVTVVVSDVTGALTVDISAAEDGTGCLPITLMVSDSQLTGLVLRHSSITVEYDAGATATMTDDRYFVDLGCSVDDTTGIGEAALEAIGPWMPVTVTDECDEGPRDILDGTITVSIPGYTMREGQDAGNITVYRVDSDGYTEDVPTTYSDGTVTFTSDRLSVFFIGVGDGMDPSGGVSEDSPSSMTLMTCAVAIVVEVLVAAAILLRRD